MFLSAKREKYEGGWRLVMYETDEAGRCVPRSVTSQFDDQIDSFFVQRLEEVQRLEGRLVAAEISPIAFFVALQNLTVKDVAARLRTSASRVEKHMTPAGFRKLDVDTLLKYSRVFDIGVADLFQVAHVEDGVTARIKHLQDRLLQVVTISISPEAPAGGGPSEGTP